MEHSSYLFVSIRYSDELLIVSQKYGPIMSCTNQSSYSLTSIQVCLNFLFELKNFFKECSTNECSMDWFHSESV